MNKITYAGFGVQALLVVLLSTIGVAVAQNQTEESGLAQNPSGDIPTHQAVANLTNATSSTEDIKQMNVIGGTVNTTINSSAGGGMTGNESSSGSMSSNMSAMGGMNETGLTNETANMTSNMTG